MAGKLDKKVVAGVSSLLRFSVPVCSLVLCLLSSAIYVYVCVRVPVYIRTVFYAPVCTRVNTGMSVCRYCVSTKTQ